MPKLTIKEIAQLAGVSISAVSIVLNNRKGVSEETRQKVNEIVQKLQYTPNPNSRRLLFNRTNNIAVLFAHNTSPLEHMFHSELNRVILHECESRGYNLIFSSYKVENNNVILPNIIKSYDVDGIIFYGDIENSITNNLNNYDIPFIIVDSHAPSTEMLSVSADYANAAYIATSYLISSGHTKVAYIGASISFQYGSQTFGGFKRAIEENNILIPLNWIRMEASDEETAGECMDNIISSPNRPTAVFCAADIYSIGVMRSIKSHGLRIPGDISVIGIDDIILSSYIDPPLTTVRIDKEEMGRVAMELLLMKIGKQDPQCSTVASDHLIVRDSIKALI